MKGNQLNIFIISLIAASCLVIYNFIIKTILTAIGIMQIYAALNIFTALLDPPSTKRNFWLGGSDRQREGTYIWYATGQALVFSDWDRGNNQPNNAHGDQDCIRYGFSARAWYDDQCNALRGTICEKK